MSLFKQPSEFETRKTLRILIYGEPGIGKSTLALSAPDAAVIDFDDGICRVHTMHRFRSPEEPRDYKIYSWENIDPILGGICINHYESIVIDTVGKMLNLMDKNIIDTDSRMGMRDGSLTAKGYGKRKKMFIDFIDSISKNGKNLIFVAHEREEKQGEIIKKRPEIGGSSAGDLIKEMDLVGYVQAIGKDRTLTFDPNECYYAKNTCYLPELIKLPVLVDKEGNAIGENNTLALIIQKYQEKQEKDKKIFDSYYFLIEEIKKQIEHINNADDANTYISIMQEMDNNKQHIFNSKMVARNLYSERVKKLGLKYNSETKQYE